jgi:hypothetical protein
MKLILGGRVFTELIFDDAFKTEVGVGGLISNR